MEYLTTKEAAVILGCSQPTARKLMQVPDQIQVLDNKAVRALWDKQRVLGIAALYGKKQIVPKGTRKCRSCQGRYREEQLTSGKCDSCRAYDWVYNFICKGDRFINKPDISRFAIIRAAIEKVNAVCQDTSQQP